VSRFQAHEETVKKSIEEIQERKSQREADLKSERQRMVVRLEREKKAVDALENEVRMLRIRKDELLGVQRVAEAQRRAARKKNEADLQAQISLQRDAIQQFQVEIQKLRIKETDRKLLAPLQAQHRNEVSDIQARIDSFDEPVLGMLADKVKEYDGLLAQDRQRSKELVAKAFMRLEELFKDTASLKGQVEHFAAKEQIKWQNLRRDIAESNVKIANAFVKRNSRPTSAHRVTSPLPKLRG
jgi:hypothetical protein